MTAFPYKLYLVTDESLCLGRGLQAVTEAAVKGGVDVVQLREKTLSVPGFIEKALRMREMLARYGVPLLINDSLEVAVKSGADGIHVGTSDLQPVAILEQWAEKGMPEGIIGLSLEEEGQLATENATRASYLAASPVFTTPTKTDTRGAWRLEGLERLRNLTAKPLVAIGGINLSNAGAVVGAGADCLAVVSAICSAPDPAKAAERLRNEIERFS